MEKQLQGLALIPRALLGSSSHQLDVAAFPQVLHPAIQQILQESQDHEDAFYNIASLGFAYDIATEQVSLNSFSLEEMACYQQLQAQCNAKIAQVQVKPAVQTAITESKQTHGAACDTANLPTTKLHDTANQSTAELLSRIKKHSGPLPLLVVDPSSQVFLSDAEGTKINRLVTNYTSEGYAELLYWKLRQLEHCSKGLPPQYVLPLSECMFNKMPHIPNIKPHEKHLITGINMRFYAQKSLCSISVDTVN